MLKKTGLLVIIAILGVYTLIAFRGPQGIPALLEKRKQITRLEEQNADLVREIGEKRNRIERLKHSPTEQELEIRNRLKLQRSGDTTFILPDQQKPN
jgi:cell division protein FtsB